MFLKSCCNLCGTGEFRDRPTLHDMRNKKYINKHNDSMWDLFQKRAQIMINLYFALIFIEVLDLVPAHLLELQ